MSKIKEGNRVIALTSSGDHSSQLRVKGKDYIVQDVKYSPCCGRQLICITDPTDEDVDVICCKKVHRFGNKRMYTVKQHFIKPEELSEKLDKAIEEENYERAALISSLMKPVEVSPN